MSYKSRKCRAKLPVLVAAPAEEKVILGGGDDVLWTDCNVDDPLAQEHLHDFGKSEASVFNLKKISREMILVLSNRVLSLPEVLCKYFLFLANFIFKDLFVSVCLATTCLELNFTSVIPLQVVTIHIISI